MASMAEESFSGGLVDGSGHPNIPLGYATRVVRNQCEGDLVVVDGDVRMMICGFGCGSDLVDEFHSFDKVLKLKNSDNRVVVALPSRQLAQSQVNF